MHQTAVPPLIVLELELVLKTKRVYLAKHRILLAVVRPVVCPLHGDHSE